MAGDAITVGILFFFGFLALSAAGLTILRFWLVEGTLDGALALIFLGGILAGTVLSIRSASPLLIRLWILVLVAGTIGVPALAARNDERVLRRMQQEEMEKYFRALEVNPQNWMAWRAIGEAYMKMNRYDDAVAAYKEAIRLNPPEVEKLRRRLNAALEYRAGLPRVTTVLCPQCGQEAPKAKICLHCGAELELNFLDWLTQRDSLAATARPAAAMTAGACATFAVFSDLPLPFKVVAIVAAATVGGYFVWRIAQNADK
jgi:tetratricopeptide (TPR) repeat protein